MTNDVLKYQLLEIQEVLRRYPEALKAFNLSLLADSVFGCLRRLNVAEMFSLNIEDFHDYHHNTYFIDQERCIGLYSDPKNFEFEHNVGGTGEWFYQIKFGEGFQYSYRTHGMDLFDEFMKFDPDYVDAHTLRMLFSPEKARKVHKSYHDVISNFKSLKLDQMRKTYIISQIADLQKQLESLK